MRSKKSLLSLALSFALTSDRLNPTITVNNKPNNYNNKPSKKDLKPN